MPRRFSKTYRTFAEWLAAHATSSPYVRRIVRGQARYLTATLSQLRRHPRSGQDPLSHIRQAPLHRLPWESLSLREQKTRIRALEVLSEARRREGSLSRLSRERGISPRTVRRATGAFGKREGRWVATRSDRIQRRLKTYEQGRRTEVLVADSRTASLVSEYAHAVQVYLETGDARLALRPSAQPWNERNRTSGRSRTCTRNRRRSRNPDDPASSQPVLLHRRRGG
jgi:AraC-like DNA-binding protein